jgi:hypothetical protein
MQTDPGTQKVEWVVDPESAEKAAAAFGRLRENVGGLREQIAALKEQPLEGLPEGKAKRGQDEGKGGKKGLGAVFKDPKVVGAYTDMVAKGTVRALFSGNVRAAFQNLGLQIAETLTAELAAYFAKQAIFRLLGLPLPFQHEGLVRSPTLALVGEREPEFIVTQERMMGLLRGGQPGYGFGPGDFGVPNVNVAAPNVAVEVTVAPGVDADIQTAYRARAGEARLSQLEG